MANPIDYKTGKHTDPRALLHRDYNNLMLEARKGMPMRISLALLDSGEPIELLDKVYMDYITAIEGN